LTAVEVTAAAAATASSSSLGVLSYSSYLCDCCSYCCPVSASWSIASLFYYLLFVQDCWLFLGSNCSF